MQSKLIDDITRNFEVELPEFETLNQYLDFLIFDSTSNIRQWSEDLTEKMYYSDENGKSWLLISDRDSDLDTVVYYFRPDGKLLKVVNGDIETGTWKILDDTNRMIISFIKEELYDLAFLSNTFFILKKHGHTFTSNNPTMLVLGDEIATSALEWKDYVEMLFNTYRTKNNTYNILIYVIAIIIGILVFLSLYR